MPVLITLAMSGLLSACSPSINATVGIGYNMQGRLIGAVKVCDYEVVRVDLAQLSKTKGVPAAATWRRTSPLTDGVDTLPLKGNARGPWTSSDPPLPPLASDSLYQIFASNEDDSYTSHALEFHGRDLAQLQPGDLLVERPGPDKNGEPTQKLAVIRVEDMSSEECGI